MGAKSAHTASATREGYADINRLADAPLCLATLPTCGGSYYGTHMSHVKKILPPPFPQTQDPRGYNCTLILSEKVNRNNIFFKKSKQVLTKKTLWSISSSYLTRQKKNPQFAVPMMSSTLYMFHRGIFSNRNN